MRYNLVGHNCETIANMCVSSGWTESYKARSYFTVPAAMDVALMLWVAGRGRAKLPILAWVLPAVVAGVLAIVDVKFIYDNQVRRFWPPGPGKVS